MLASPTLAANAAADSSTPVQAVVLQELAARPGVRAFESALELLVLDHDINAMLSALGSIESRMDLSPLVRSRLRYTTLMSFARVAETAPARTQLEPYLALRPEIYTWHEDGPYRVAMPVFDPAAAAAFTFARWNDRAWYRRASAGLRSHSALFLDEWLAAREASGGRLSPAGLVGAFQKATPDELAEWPSRLERLLGEGASVADLAMVVASRLRDVQLAATIIDDADTLSALHFLEDFSGWQDTSKETAMLARALRREDLASAALYRLGQLDSHAAHELLLGQLASREHGGSAAAALARRINPELVESLATMIRSDPNMLARRRAVLALQLAPGSMGHRALTGLRSESDLPEELLNLLARQLP